MAAPSGSGSQARVPLSQLLHGPQRASDPSRGEASDRRVTKEHEVGNDKSPGATRPPALGPSIPSPVRIRGSGSFPPDNPQDVVCLINTVCLKNRRTSPRRMDRGVRLPRGQDPAGGGEAVTPRRRGLCSAPAPQPWGRHGTCPSPCRKRGFTESSPRPRSWLSQDRPILPSLPQFPSTVSFPLPGSPAPP